MKRTIALVYSIAAVLANGCAVRQVPPAEAQAKRDEIQRTIPTCASEKECNAKWEAAQLWVVKNAGYKIQTATGVLIETYNASRSRVDLAAQVIKEPLGGGRYQFVLKVWCDNRFGCSPDTLDAKVDFNRTLNAVNP